MNLEGGEDEGYFLSTGRFDSIEDAVEFYRERLNEGVKDRDASIYGNDELSMEALSSKGTYALFKSLDDPITEEGKWAVNALRTIETFAPNRERDDFYEGVIDSLSAATFYTVARAETGGDVGAQQYRFHHSIATELRKASERSTEIDQIQEELQEHDEKLELAEDYLGKIDRRGKSLEGRVRQIEDELEDHNSRQYELLQSVSDNTGHLDIIYDDIVDLGQEVIDNSERLEIAYDDIVDLSQELRSLEAIYEDLNQSLDDLSQNIESINERISELDETSTRLEQADRAVEERLEAVEKMVTGLEGQIESLEAEVPEKPEGSETPKILEIGLTQYIEDLNAELSSLEEETQENEDSISQLQTNVEDIRNNLEEIKHQPEKEDDESTGLLGSIENWIRRRKTGWKQTEIDDWVSESDK